jgi:clan AA aspartic protease (TIGR02281 family)
MNGVKLACGCACVAIALAGQLSHMVDRKGAKGGAGEIPIGRLVPAAYPAPLAKDPGAVATEAAPRPAPSTASGSEIVMPDRSGQFQTAVEIEGQRIEMLVDTGASVVLLSFEDADRIGLRPMPGDFTMPIATANGRSFAALAHLRDVRLGRIQVHDVVAYIAARGAVTGSSLLGMSFLSKLNGYGVDAGRLVLRQ